MAESGFDPNAGSPAGAQGIAQFMPGTAASYGLADPYDPVAAIDAETQAYVTRILALLGGAGALVAPIFGVRLVA